MMRIICSDNLEVGIESYGLVADLDNFGIKSICSIYVDDGKVTNIEPFPMDNLQSFYVHSVGMISCNIACPEFITKEMDRRSVNKLLSDEEKLAKIMELK